MTDKISDKRITIDLNSLPEELKFYLISDISGDVILDLAKEYKINEDDLYSLAYVSINSVYDFSVIEEKIKKLDLTGISSKKFLQDYTGRFLLPVSVYVEEMTKGKVNIVKYLQKIGAKVESYQKYIDNFMDEIENKNLEELKEMADNFADKFNTKEERAYIFDLLSSDVKLILRSESYEAASGLNRSLIYLLFNDKDFKDNALRKLFANREMIGSEKINVDDKEVSPSISSWLKDFIKKNGSSFFDDIVLAQYLNTSENAQKLNPEDKELLGNLIRFYKNLAFFPESMDNTLPHQWQIFPFKEDETSSLQKLEIPNNISDSPELGNDDVLSNNKYQPEASKDSEEIKELKTLMSNYPPASLERKAILEEIKRLEAREEVAQK